MKIGLHINAITYTDLPWEAVCRKARAFGVQTLEPGSGGFVGKSHCNPQVLLKDKEKFEKFTKILEKHNLKISALSCHGNPLHPNRSIADQHSDDVDCSIELAKRLNIKIVNCFAGCPGLDTSSAAPAWVTILWP